MTDRLFRHALLTDGRRVDLGVSSGRFVDIDAIEDGCEVVDLGGLLVLSGFIDGHIHLDKSFVGDGWGTREPARSLRQLLTIEKRVLNEALRITDDADAAIERAHAFGTVAMRGHVDVDATTGLLNLHAVLEARERWEGRIAVELVAFPQSGILRSAGTAQFLEAAVREGADVVGGIDPTALDGDADGHLDIVFGIAGRHGVKVDIHLHERGGDGIGQLERIAARTSAMGMAGLVTVSHAYALGDVSADEVKRIAAILERAGVSIVTNAPGDRAFPPVMLLKAAGVHVFAGNNNIGDACWPYGSGDMLQKAMLIGYRSGFHTNEELRLALDMVTIDGARALGLDEYGFAIGNEATFNIVDTANAAVADRILVRRGEFDRGAGSSLARKLAHSHATVFHDRSAMNRTGSMRLPRYSC